MVTTCIYVDSPHYIVTKLIFQKDIGELPLFTLSELLVSKIGVTLTLATAVSLL